MYGAGRKPSTEPMLMMRPPPWCRMWGTTARVIRTIPKKFVSKIDRAWSIELSSAPAGATPKPALVTSRAVRASDRMPPLTAAVARDAKAAVVHEQVDAALQPHHLLDGSFHGCVAGHVQGQHLERSLACRAPP